MSSSSGAPPNGLGPWFCALIINLSFSKKCKEQSHLVAHTSPHLYVDWLNNGVPSSKRVEGCVWITLMKIGPFLQWHDAARFQATWLNKTRSRQRRIERGLELYAQHRERYQLRMWAQYQTRDEALRTFEAADPYAEEGARPVLVSIARYTRQYGSAEQGMPLHLLPNHQKEQKKRQKLMKV